MPASSLTPPFLAELEAEAATTRRVLAVVPEARLAWRPHPKSYTLGQLAWHVATLPDSVTQLITPASVAAETVDFTTPQPKTVEEVLAAFDASLAAARRTIDAWTDAELHATWRLTAGGAERMAQPRIGLLRAFAFNHLYHHRGQLTVYLRLLDVALPSVYGPSADENPLM